MDIASITVLPFMPIRAPTDVLKVDARGMFNFAELSPEWSYQPKERPQAIEEALNGALAKLQTAYPGMDLTRLKVRFTSAKDKRERGALGMVHGEGSDIIAESRQGLLKLR